MSEKIKVLKEKIESGNYDWNSAIETTAEKLVLLDSLDMWF